MTVDDFTIRFVLKDELTSMRECLAATFKEQAFPKGHHFNMVGFENGQLYYLLDGEVDVYTSNEEGYMRLIGIHQRNTIFNLDNLVGEAAVITTIASQPTHCLVFSNEQLFQWLKAYPQYDTLLLRYIAKVLRLMCYDAKEQSIHDVRTRLLHFFLLYIRNNDTINIPFSQQRLASAINASRIQVTRLISELKNSGLIEVHRNRIVILSVDGLEKALHKKSP